ncbi:hypothetical protein [Sphingopyxis indica]|jgi:hypothetical protein|uniref:Uncharacterized protein n=1 Tax=Sphingopyxis indica TaxID=436663 RepID=A0A239L7M0_9SPHN|nr:hypothetical protein [Sphingopyxis indica]SNT26280.1 hypothetical protein SAMN06295955_12013 [Sphingopyxis indica]
MLVLVEGNKEKSEAQKAMEASVTGHLHRIGKRNIGFPSGNVDEIMYANGDGSLWAAFSNAADAKVPRRWNAFGVFDNKRYSQMISVEINVPTTSNCASVAGFFARSFDGRHLSYARRERRWREERGGKRGLHELVRP